MAKPQRVHYTWDDLLKFPEDDGKRYEIIDGELFVSPTPILVHQFVVGELYTLLRAWADRRGGIALLSPLDCILADDTVLEPDVLWISPERMNELLQDWVRGVPDLVVEVLSPSTARRDRSRKADAYARFGAQEYWLVDPKDGSVEIRRLESGRWVQHASGRGDDRLTSSLDPALIVIPSTLFPQWPEMKKPGPKTRPHARKRSQSK